MDWTWIVSLVLATLAAVAVFLFFHGFSYDLDVKLWKEVVFAAIAFVLVGGVALGVLELVQLLL